MLHNIIFAYILITMYEQECSFFYIYIYIFLHTVYISILSVKVKHF